MPDVIEASCAAGVVALEGTFPEPSATVFSEGIGASEGVALIVGGKVYYLTSNASDLKTTLDNIVNILTELTTALTAIDAKPTGGSGSASTPVATANVVNLAAISVQLAALKEALK